MNILIPHSWLLEHLETDVEPVELQRLLSLSGPSVERIYEREGEAVYDIEVTTNRVDMMSVRGIAREAAVILTQAGRLGKLKPLADQTWPSPTTSPLPLPKIINNSELCARTTCLILADIQRTPTPDWMAKRLRQIDQNVHDSVIDITNYATHELGYPCHAFDYDAIMRLGGEIIVTEAKPGQPFTTLDGLSYETVGGEVVFTNPAGEIIDLPAVKGTANTSITDQTQNVLLWIEAIPAAKVRFASMTHAIRTVAAQLAEKHVDPHLADPLLKFAIRLYQDLTHAQIASDLYDDFPGRQEPQSVKLPLQTVSTYLGIELPTDQILNILENLECQVSVAGAELEVTPPTFRENDLRIPADFVEEIARMYGYHNLPSKLMDTPIPVSRPFQKDFDTEAKLKTVLSLLGWQELYTYSLVSPELAEQSDFPLTEHLKLANPLTDDKVYLRRSLIPSLQEVVNHQPSNTKLALFEVANTYQPQSGDIPKHTMQLTLLSNHSYRWIRGCLETLANKLFINSLEVSESGDITLATDQTSRSAGRIQLLDSGLIAVESPLAAWTELASTSPHYQPGPGTNVITEDLTFTLPAKTTVGEVIKTIKSVTPTLREVEVVSTYQQNVTFTLSYQDPEQNLTSQDVEPWRKTIIEKVHTAHTGQLVGELQS